MYRIFREGDRYEAWRLGHSLLWVCYVWMHLRRREISRECYTVLASKAFGPC